MHIPERETNEFMDAFDLVYSSPSQKGYKRVAVNGQFIYKDDNERIIESSTILKRINQLVLPPAWKDVWICKRPNGHLQATGIDAKGRKQYKYHAKWEKIRSLTKFHQLFYFGTHLNKLRKQLSKDLRRKSLNKEKVTALALSIMEQTLIRVGNTAYEKAYGSYGLTTLKNKHIHFKEKNVFLKFKGKKGVDHLITLKRTALTHLLKKVKELPGQELFQYFDDNKELQALNSTNINTYLKEYMGEAFTCKDFRTWAGCVSVLEFMAKEGNDDEISKTEMQKKMIKVIDLVAKKLGNTRTVCKKYYIHPELLAILEEGKLKEILPNFKNSISTNQIEKAFLRFLKKEIKQKI